jgi:hypothetical protein
LSGKVAQPIAQDGEFNIRGPYYLVAITIITDAMRALEE